MSDYVTATSLDSEQRAALNRRLAEALAKPSRWRPFRPADDHNDAFYVLGQLPYRARLMCLNAYWTCQLTSTDPACPPHLRYLSAIAETAPLAISLAAEKTMVNDKMIGEKE